MKKKIFVLGISILLAATTAYSAEKTGCAILKKTVKCEQQNSDKCEELAKKIYEDRATLYNVLNLSPCQIKIKDEIEKKRLYEIDVTINKLCQERYVLSKLTKNDVSQATLDNQKRLVENLEKQEEYINKKYDNEFCKSLCFEQKRKYCVIKKMIKKDIENCRKDKKMYKQCPKLRPFGQPYNYEDCGCDDVKEKRKHSCGCGCK